MKKILIMIIGFLLILNAIGTVNSKTIDKSKILSNLQYIKQKNSDDASSCNQEQYELLIICKSANFYFELENLVEHKNNNRNMPTKLVQLRDILYDFIDPSDPNYDPPYFTPTGRDVAEKIKYFIYNASLPSEDGGWGVKYVLLVGDTELLPSRLVRTPGTDYPIPEYSSDLYFADIYDSEGNFSSWDANKDSSFGDYSNDKAAMDLCPDVCVGRLACSTSDEVTNMVNKIIRYENGNMWDNKKIMLCGGDSATKDEIGLMEGEFLNQQVIDNLPGVTPIKLWASDNTLTKNNIKNTIEVGVDFIDLSGHGPNPSKWLTHPPYDSDVDLPDGGYLVSDAENLRNSKLPIIVINSCLCGKFDTNSDCLGWAFVNNPAGGGIACFAYSTLVDIASPGSGDNSLSDRYLGWIEVNIFKELYSNRVPGDVWRNIISSYLTDARGYAGVLHESDYRLVEAFTLFGDPSLNKVGEGYEGNKPPTDIIITGNTTVTVDELETYTFVSTDPDGDKVQYEINWGDGETSTWEQCSLVNSGEPYSQTHTYKFATERTIEVYARDEKGYECILPGTLDIKIIKDDNINIDMLQIIVKKLSMVKPLINIIPIVSILPSNIQPISINIDNSMNIQQITPVKQALVLQPLQLFSIKVNKLD